MQITLDTKLADIARHYGEPGKESIYDNLDAIGDDLIDTREVGEDWGWALDRVLRNHGEDEATVRHLRDELYEHACRGDG